MKGRTLWSITELSDLGWKTRDKEKPCEAIESIAMNLTKINIVIDMVLNIF